jgi:hypothetical protein
MVLNARINLAQIVRAAILLSTASCDSCEPEPVVNPAIASVEILPLRVAVGPGMTFNVRARVRDASGNALPDQRAAGVSWTSTGGLDVPASAARSIMIKANPGAATLPLDTKLIASIDGVSATGIVTIVPTAPTGGTTGDWIASPFGDRDPPTISLVSGMAVAAAASTPQIDAPFAFAGQGPLESLQCLVAPADCGEVIIFPPHHAPARTIVGWTTGCDFASFVGGLPVPTGCSAVTPPPPLPLGDPVHVSVFIWKASSSWGLDGHITKDIEHARKVLEQRWSGLILDVTIQHTYDTGIIRGAQCQSDDEYDITKQLPHIPSTDFKKDRITVVYVKDISVPDPSVPAGSIPTGELAYTCPYDSGEGAIILIAGSGDLSTNLAHELGHALGQWPPPAPIHPDAMTGFDRSNLMWSEESDMSRAIREQLTLGQWFQMTLAKSSFIRMSQLAAPVANPCQTDPAIDAVCPRLAKDIAQ